MEAELLKQRAIHDQLSPLLQSFRLPMPVALDTIQDPSIQQRFKCHYEQLLQRAKSEIIDLHFYAAEARRDEADQQFATEQKLFSTRRRTSFGSDIFTEQMLNITNRRLRVVEDRIKTLLDLKLRWLVADSVVINKR